MQNSNSNQIEKNQNLPTVKPQFRTGLSKITDTYTNMIINNFQNIRLNLDAYQKVCLANAIAKIQELLYQNELDFNSEVINQNNLTTILEQISMFRLNAAANPRECYFQLRNDNEHNKKLIEFGIEGNGNDAILRNFGVDVKNVLPPIIIREGDEFTYPYFDGEKMQPFTWKPKSFYKKPIAVVYIIIKNDDTKEYLVSEREAVANNLKAHINNNMLTCKDYKLKKRITDKIKDMTLEQMIGDQELTNAIKTEDGKYLNLISPAWKSAHSKEEMIIRKMKNNAIKKYPKDFSNAYVESSYETTFEDSEQYRHKDVINAEDIIQEVEKAQVQENASVKPPLKDNTVQEKPEQPIVDSVTGEVKEEDVVNQNNDSWMESMVKHYGDN